MPSLSLRALFRQVPKEQFGFPLDARLRILAAGVIGEDGDARRVLRFLAEYTQFWGALQQRAFPARPKEVRPLHAVELSSMPAAIEYTALSLLKYADRLTQFEARREATGPWDGTEPDEVLATIEREFGYSNWLAGQLVGNLPPNSPLQVKLVNAITDDENLILTSLFIKEKYALSCYSLGSSDASRYLRTKRYPDPLTAFLVSSLDPLPVLSAEEARLALTVVVGLPAVDRWMTLIRCLQSLLVHGKAEDKASIASLSALQLLLERIESIEGANLASALAWAAPSASPRRTSADEWLSSFASGTDERPSPPVAAAVFDALRGMADPQLWAGNAAILDRQALAASGTRAGGVFGATARQVAVLSERRAEEWMHWLRLTVHPDVLNDLPDGNVIRHVRLRSIGAAQRERYVTAANANMVNNHFVVASTLESAQDRHPEETALLLDAMIVLRRGADAVRQVREALVSDSAIIQRVPFDEVAALISNDPASELSAAVDRTIVAEACVRYGVAGALTKRNDSFDDVLALAGTRLPSATVGSLADAELSAETVRYFLHRLCTPPVMDTVPVGRSTEELLAERIAILNALRSLDPDNHAAYELESREVAMIIAAKKEMATLDQQRVYVDVPGLSARLVVQLAGDFERYRRFARLDPRAQEASALQKFVREYFPDMTVLDLQDLSRALTSESDGVLLKMILAAREEFATSHDFGLDGYLSGGIRHGNLEALLREPFAKMQLLGAFWGNGTFEPPGITALLGTQDDIVGHFASFAKGFQAIVEEVLSEWIRIDYSSGESRALFDLTAGRADIRLLGTRVHECQTVEEFVDRVVGYWLDRVDVCLEDARERIGGELRTRLHEVHDNLESALRVARPGPLVDNLVAPARGGIDTAVDRLVDWFRRVSDDGAGTVDVRVPVEVSANLMKYMFPHVTFAWDVRVELSRTRLSRRCIKPWVDIIHTLLMNAVKYGGGGAECPISVRLFESGEGVRLEVVNRLADPTSAVEVDSALADAMIRLGLPEARASTSAEGRTGLAKVLKWAKVDLRCPPASIRIGRKADHVEVVVDFPGGVPGLEAA